MLRSAGTRDITATQFVWYCMGTLCESPQMGSGVHANGLNIETNYKNLLVEFVKWEVLSRSRDAVVLTWLVIHIMTGLNGWT